MKHLQILLILAPLVLFLNFNLLLTIYTALLINIFYESTKLFNIWITE